MSNDTLPLPGPSNSIRISSPNLPAPNTGTGMALRAPWPSRTASNTWLTRQPLTGLSTSSRLPATTGTARKSLGRESIDGLSAGRRQVLFAAMTKRPMISGVSSCCRANINRSHPAGRHGLADSRHRSGQCPGLSTFFASRVSRITNKAGECIGPADEWRVVDGRGGIIPSKSARYRKWPATKQPAVDCSRLAKWHF
jgi:hypothetical protein